MFKGPTRLTPDSLTGHANDSVHESTSLLSQTNQLEQRIQVGQSPLINILQDQPSGNNQGIWVCVCVCATLENASPWNIEQYTDQLFFALNTFGTVQDGSGSKDVAPWQDVLASMLSEVGCALLETSAGLVQVMLNVLIFNLL